MTMPLRSLTPEQRHAISRVRIDLARLWLLPVALAYVPMGIGTMMGYAGKPQDAPHLLLPETLRGIMWIVTGLVAFAVLTLDRDHEEGPTRTAAALLLVMPMVRTVSYGLAWIYSIVDLDGEGGLSGSDAGYYTVLPWAIMSWAILSQAIPWRPLARKARRKFWRRA